MALSETDKKTLEYIENKYLIAGDGRPGKTTHIMGQMLRNCDEDRKLAKLLISKASENEFNNEEYGIVLRELRKIINDN